MAQIGEANILKCSAMSGDVVFCVAAQCLARKGEAMILIQTTGVGVLDLLLNAPTTKAREGKLKPAELMEQATRRARRDADGDTILDADQVMECLLAGARFGGFKQDKKSVATYLEAIMRVEQHPTLENNKGQRDYDRIDSRPGRVPPRTGAMVDILRPQFDSGWKFHARIWLMNDLVKTDTIRQIVACAGQYCGLGSYRPRHGLFVVEQFDVQVVDDKASTLHA